MALTYLIDENLRGILADTLRRVAIRSGFDLDVIQVGDREAPSRGTRDADLLAWAASENRILISRDKTSMPLHLANHLAFGRSSPGIFVLREGRLSALAEHLVLVAFATEPEQWKNLLSFIP